MPVRPNLGDTQCHGCFKPRAHTILVSLDTEDVPQAHRMWLCPDCCPKG